MKDFQHYLNQAKQNNENAEHVIKLQKPDSESFINVSDGTGDCTVCLAQNVNVDDHVCQTLLEGDETSTMEGYTEEEIKTVLWNTFKEKAKSITCLYDEYGSYGFDVVPAEGVGMDVMLKTAQELKDSDLFDIQPHWDHMKILFKNPYVFEYHQYIMMKEYKEYMNFTDENITYYKGMWSRVDQKYRNNDFYKSIMSKLERDKKLSKKQFDELDFLLKNNKSRYEAGQVSLKN